VLKSPGAQDGYYGVQIENSDTGYVFLNWESLKHHQDLIASPSYPAVIESLSHCLGGPAKMYHVQFSGVLNALKEPITEVFTFKLNAPEQREAVVGYLKTAADVGKGTIAFGQTVEDENLYIMLCGWASLEAHAKRAEESDAKTARDFFSTIGEIEMKHTKLTQFIP